MKSIFFSLGLMSLFLACREKTDITRRAHSTAVTGIFDPTDKRKLWPTANPVLTLFACEQYPDAEGVFRLAAITDKKLNPSFSAYLPSRDSSEKLNRYDDVQHRSKTILAFYAAVRKDFSDAYSLFDTSKAMAYSQCWNTINSELFYLVETKSENKILIVASDLMERSEIDAYNEVNKKEPQAIAKKLQEVYPAPEDLHGITIIFVYQPLTRTEDMRFSKMLKVYRILLETPGAKIKVQATNKSYEP